MINKKDVWIAAGAVCVRLQDGSQPLKILPSMDITKIPGLSQQRRVVVSQHSVNICSSLVNIQICHLNAQSLIPHIDEFRDHFRVLDYDVIAVSKSWLSSSVVDAQLNLPQFHLLRNDRKTRHGGGVLLFIRNTLSSRIINCSSNLLDGYPEYIIAEVWTTLRNKILISVIYRPPNTDLLNDFERDFSELFMFYKNIVILGDLNINMLVNTNLSAHLNDFCNSYNLNIVPFSATHHHGTSHTWIDHCIINDINNLVDSCQSDVLFLSGHDIISVTLNFSVPRHSPSTFRCRNWSLITNKSIADIVGNSSALFHDNYQSVDDSISYLNQNVFHIIDSIAPEHVIKASRPSAPWISSVIRDLQHRRDKLYRIYRRSGYAYEEYCNVRRLVKKRIIEAKKNYLQDRFRYPRCPKAVWNDFRRLGLLRDSSKVFILPDLDLNQLNDHFVSVGSSGRNYVNHQNVCINDSNALNQFNFVEITEEDVKRNLKRITTAAVGPDGLSITSQAVKHGDCLSSWQCSRSGVLQGSVLEPLLFSLFVSTLGLQIESKHLFYADDLVVYVSCSISDLNDAVLQLNADVDLIVEWCTNNLLKLNAAKTKSIIFNSPWHVKDQACVSARKIVTGDVVTNYSVSVKYLGIILDHTLSWHDQVIAMCNRSIILLQDFNLLTSVRVRSVRQTDVLCLPFARTTTFDNSFIVTAVRTWNQLPEEIVTIADYNEFRSKCYNLSNNSIRFICNSRRDAHITFYKQSLNWLTI
ncbi:Similar to RTase: Probable RNA-directed DNA polymerase from transposon BS (Drosophila melanogaster) [Cotesia congregata]|uniref:Similar to RTase: Probable RNA-directed DNA polymerase from transposon BS (Drosophila melanogaster) n=1 Tax=Cotesia congregata TaxID=51543 RepID=A0A8J2EHX6_COTCN|nr:Similar to RTase: Probable RNA-directed DNA polymerase from transposon BS (Drosophila melanogaster) [Cotesia congregata]